jgi:branched-chain amino acid transport system permease protein
VNVEVHKNRIFALSAALAGASGALYAYLTSYISPETFGIDLSVLVVAMAVIGGLGNVGGAVVGAIFLVVFPEFTRQYGEWRDLIYGLVLFVVLVFLPRGLWGIYEDAVERIGRLFARWRRSR